MTYTDQNICSATMDTLCVQLVSPGCIIVALRVGKNLGISDVWHWRKWPSHLSFLADICHWDALKFFHITASSSMKLNAILGHTTAPMQVLNALLLVIFLS